MPKVDLYFLFDVGVFDYLDVHLFPTRFRDSNGLGDFLGRIIS